LAGDKTDLMLGDVDPLYINPETGGGGLSVGKEERYASYLRMRGD